MTRILSESLAAREPSFRLGIRQLEHASGNPNHDIRLTAELLRATKVKVWALGLDPHDTTGEELYQTLQARVASDDARLERVLRTRAAQYVSAEADVSAGLLHVLEAIPAAKSFAIKATVLRTLLKKQPPKRVMKQLGYRSLVSLIKHESSAQLLAAAYIVESDAWRRSFTDQYKKLSARDFEERPISISSPSGARWKSLSEQLVARSHTTVLGLRELGSVVIFPLPDARPDGSVIASFVLAVQELNEIQALSTYLHMIQVQPQFGSRLLSAIKREPVLEAQLLDQSVPWQLVQRFYSGVATHLQDDVLEPYLRLEDFAWHHAEDLLAQIAPSFEFWKQSAHLSLLDTGHPVSLNLLDNALSCCNKLSYAQRRVSDTQAALMNELRLRYLRHETLSQALLSELQPKMAPAMAEV